MNEPDVLRFRATQVTFDECDHENIAYAFFQSKAFPQGRYLMISRFLGSKKKGDVFVEYNDQAQVSVGGVSTYHLREDNLTLEIPTEAAEALGIPEVRRIVVDLDLPSASISELRRALAAVFADSRRDK